MKYTNSYSNAVSQNNIFVRTIPIIRRVAFTCKRVSSYSKYCLLSIALSLFTVASVAQVRSNGANSPVIPGENAFLDAGSNFIALTGSDASVGKGLIFPRADLTVFEFNTGIVDEYSFNTLFDGMIVYNVGTGNTIINNGLTLVVTPGFYYFSNPTGDAINNPSVTSGHWIRIADQNDLKTTPSGTTLPVSPAPSPGDVFYNTTTKSLYYYKDTQWVPVSSTPSGLVTPAVIDSKLGDVFYLTNANPALSALEIFNGTAWVLASSTADGSIVDSKLQASGGGVLATGNVGQVLSSAGSNQFKWVNAGSTPGGAVLPGVAPAGNTFYNTSTHTYWVSDGTTWIPAGTATSVGLSLPSFMTVSNSPVTTTGVLTGTLASQSQATFFAAPSSASGAPAFRAIQDTDIPSLANKIDVSSKGAALGVAPLDASQKVPSTYLPDAILGSVTYKGTYNANTGLPSLASASAANKGFYYVVDVIGSTPMNLGLGDWVISNGTAWEKVSNSGAVPSVFGRSGAVVATAGDYTSDLVTEGSTNKYYTDALANMNPTLTGKEDVANKVNAIAADASFTKYPTVDAVKSYVDAKVPAGGSNGQVLTIASSVPTWVNGGVSSVSVADVNGVSGTVANPTTTPAITIILKDIKPTSITTAGTITAATLSGSLDAAKLTGSIAAARYAANTIPIAAINASGTKSAGMYLDGTGAWSVPSGGSGALPGFISSDANKVLTINPLGNATIWAAPGANSVPDATASTKGIIQLAGDLTGTADAPTVQYVSGFPLSVPASGNTIVLRDASGNMSGNIDGNAATATFATSATSATNAGTVTSAAQPAITSVGVLTGLSVATPIVGDITGNANTASTATSATNVAITDVSAGALMYPTFVNGTGNKPLDVNTATLKYAPSTGTLSATNFNGALNATLLTGTIPTARYGTNLIPLAALNAGTVNTNAFLKGDGTWAVPTAGSGTVTSVGLTMPAIFTITNSPITTNGTLTASLVSQSSHVVLASPADGSVGTPAFRTLAGADISDFATKVDVSSKGQANGVVPLDGSSKILPVYLPSSVTGAVTYKGTFDASTGKLVSDNTSLPAVGSSLGYYYVVTVPGNNPMALNTGDWVICNGTTWDRVANGGTVSSVFTRTGAVIPMDNDYNTNMVPEGGNIARRYYSDALVSANTTVVAKEDNSNKVNVIAADGTFTKYPTVDAIKSYVDAKVPTTGGNGQVLMVVSGNPQWQTPASGSGTVTSVGLALPAIFTVSNSPVTGTGTLTGALNSQGQATFLAGPASGTGVPAFRTIATTDVPTLNQNTTGSAATATTAGTVTTAAQPNITSVGTLTGLTVTATINGGVTGNAGSATNTAITDDVSNVASVFPTWVTTASGYMPQKVSSTKLTFIPSSGTLTATSFSGNLNANNLSSGTVPIARLGSSGTADATTYLRGDGTWFTPAGGSGDMLLGTSQTVTALKTFNNSMIAMKGSGTGITTLTSANASASGYTITLPATTGTVGLTSLPLSQFATTTSAQMAGVVSDKTGSGLLVFGTSPTLTTPVLGVASATSLSATSTVSGTQLISTVATGTPPLTVTSTTPVPNLSIGGTAAAASATTITDDGTTAVSVFPTWVTATAGNMPTRITSTKLSFIPSTGVLTATSFNGSLNASNLTAGTIPAARIATNSIPVADMLTTSGTASATTYLRGDGTWSTPAGGSGLPASVVADATKVLTVDGSGAPIWQAPASGGGGGIPIPAVAGTQDQVLTSDATGTASWKTPVPGGFIMYHPSGDANMFCKASGPGVTAVFSPATTLTITIPAGVRLFYFKVWTTQTLIGGGTTLWIIIDDHLNGGYNNDVTDVVMPVVVMSHVNSLAPLRHQTYGQSNTTVWNINVLGGGIIGFNNAGINSFNSPNGFYVMMTW